jgi:hypothetical protein
VTKVNAVARIDKPVGCHRALKSKLESVATESSRLVARRLNPGSSGTRSDSSSSSDASSSDSDDSDSSGSGSSGSVAEESEDEASALAVQRVKERSKLGAAAQPATTSSVVNIKEEGRKEIDAGESSDAESSEDSNDSANSSDSDIADPSDWIKELAWEVEAPAIAESKPSGKRVTKRKRSFDEQGAIKHTLKSMVTHTVKSLAKINSAFDNNSRDEAIGELQRLLAGIMNQRSAANPTDKVPAIAEAIDRASRSIMKSPMSFKEYALVGKTAATLKRLVKARPIQCSALKR